MDLTASLLRAALPHALIVTAAGSTGVRLAAERQLRSRGWPEAASPADADLLVLCGAVSGRLAAATDRVWQQMPAPRVRVPVSAVSAVGVDLDAALGRLTDATAMRRDARERGDEPDAVPDMPDMPDMHHHMHGGMSLPGGLQMASRGDDRDGLKLDVLHLPLGPILPAWPTGLTIDCVLQGDVLQQAEPVPPDPAPGAPFWPATIDRQGAPAVAAAAADSLQRFLTVAGWAAASVALRRIRDGLLAGSAPPDAGRWLRRVQRSRVLRWSTDGLGEVSSGPLAGDATTRWQRWAEQVSAGLDGRAAPEDRSAVTTAGLDVLPRLLRGQDLAAARVIVASLDPDLELAGVLR